VRVHLVAPTSRATCVDYSRSAVGNLVISGYAGLT